MDLYGYTRSRFVADVEQPAICHPSPASSVAMSGHGTAAGLAVSVGGGGVGGGTLGGARAGGGGGSGKGVHVKHMSAEQLEAMNRKRRKEIASKQREMAKCGERILDLKDSVSTITVKLKDKRSHEKDFRVSQSRISSHTKTIDIDREKRSSDRDFEIRNYSKMDGDVWRYDQVRNWFNTYAVDQPPERFIPSETGYTLKID